MIGLLALVIAFLTLLSPAPEVQSSPVEPADGLADAAILADGSDGLDVLLGRWRVQLVPTASASLEASTREDIVLEIQRGRTGPPRVRFGPPEEPWSGEMRLSRDGDQVEFASRTTCETWAERGSDDPESQSSDMTGYLTGRLRSGELKGTLLLEGDEELVPWRAIRLPEA